MTLAALIKKGGLNEFATANSATAATESGRNNGTVAKLAKVAVAKSQNPEIVSRPETDILDDPLLSPELWYPSFREFHHSVIRETPDFSYCEFRQQHPELYRRVKAMEEEIDALGPARLSTVMAILRAWRELILQTEFNRREAMRKRL